MSAQELINWLHVIADSYEQFTDSCVDEKRPDTAPTFRAEVLLKVKSSSGQAGRRFPFFSSAYLLRVLSQKIPLGYLLQAILPSQLQSSRYQYSGFLSNQTRHLEMLPDWRSRLSHIHCVPEELSAGQALPEDLGCSTPLRAIATFSQCLDQIRESSGAV